MKGYIIMDANFQYNDEIYYNDDCDAGRPTTMYFEKDKAKKVCAEQTRNWLRGVDLAEYFYEIDELFGHAHVDKGKKLIIDNIQYVQDKKWKVSLEEDSRDYLSLKFTEDSPDEFLDQLVDIMCAYHLPYNVTEVEVDESIVEGVGDV